MFCKKKQAVRKKLLLFGNSDIDSFFMPPKIYSQSVSEVKLKHVNSDVYKEAVKEWDRYVETSKATKVGKGVVIGTTTYGGHILGKLIGAEGLGDAIGAVSGFVFENVGKGIVRDFSTPKEAMASHNLENLIDNAKTGAGTKVSCERINESVNKGTWLFFPTLKDALSNFLKGFVSPVDKEQLWVKELLPKIRGKARVKSKVIDSIQDAYDAHYKKKWIFGYAHPNDNMIKDTLCTIDQYKNNYPKTLEMEALYPSSSEAEKHFETVIPKILRYLKG